MVDDSEQPPSDSHRLNSNPVSRQRQQPYNSRSPYVPEVNGQTSFRSSQGQKSLEQQTRKMQLQNPYSQSPRLSRSQGQNPCSPSPRQSQICKEADYYRNNAVKKRPLAETSPNATTFQDNSSRKSTPYKIASLSQQACQSLSNDSVFAIESPSVSRISAASTFQSLPKKTSRYAPITALKLLNSRRHEEEYNIEQVLYLVPPISRGQEPPSWLKLGLGITELAGEAGSGKSQMAMSLCVQAVLNHHLQPTSSTKAIYISLAGGQGTSSRVAYRMQQMAESCHELLQQNYQHHHWHQPSHSDQQSVQQEQEISNDASSQHEARLSPPIFTENIQSLLSQILTRSVRNQDELFTLLREELPQLLQQQQQSAASAPSQPSQQYSVSVIVLDSIADLFRVGNGEGAFEAQTNLADRASLLFEVASLLRRLSDRFRVPVVVINQVSSDLSTNSTIPTLGLSWANCVNASYLLRRAPASTQPAGTARMIFLTKSPCFKVGQKAVFRLCRQGVLLADEEKVETKYYI